jgi:hypothetical protein
MWRNRIAASVVRSRKACFNSVSRGPNAAPSSSVCSRRRAHLELRSKLGIIGGGRLLEGQELRVVDTAVRLEERALLHPGVRFRLCHGHATPPGVGDPEPLADQFVKDVLAHRALLVLGELPPRFGFHFTEVGSREAIPLELADRNTLHDAERVAAWRGRLAARGRGVRAEGAWGEGTRRATKHGRGERWSGSWSERRSRSRGHESRDPAPRLSTGMRNGPHEGPPRDVGGYPR